MFAVTNIDDLLVLTLFFGQAAGHRGAVARVVAGQYLGFGVILAASVAGAYGARLLPSGVLPYLGVVPLALGLGAAWTGRRGGWDGERPPAVSAPAGPGLWQVAAVTVASGGDNIGVYVPVFAAAGATGISVYTAVFVVGVGVWCASARYLSTRPVIANALARWGHVLLPVVLIGIGLIILIDGGAFGL